MGVDLEWGRVRGRIRAEGRGRVGGQGWGVMQTWCVGGGGLGEGAGLGSGRSWEGGFGGFRVCGREGSGLSGSAEMGWRWDGDGVEVEGLEDWRERGFGGRIRAIWIELGLLRAN